MIHDLYTLMQPIYPLLIQQWVDDYGLSEGIAADIGTGPGRLGLELAKLTPMHIQFVDSNQETLETAKANFDTLQPDNTSEFIHADVQNLPMADNTVDFVMSRGSIWFWDKPDMGLREIYRILKPGGIAVIGGGLGRYMPDSMRNRLFDAMQNALKRRNETRPSLQEYKEIVKKAHLPNYRMFTDGNSKTGRWVEITK
ncbi:SAM-dependent methyltransferase [candidate division KSB3 bacterium]|uniref:SAM-dependent methyltransferase n=1 Tax=candidate division KSB3 bacterium TaxID=2044937 RepID=A0A2G6KIN1_9BACT|nr:MAG: SAM-dependent methyltransferase [candidate division KSB3 bacterium]